MVNPPGTRLGTWGQALARATAGTRFTTAFFFGPAGAVAGLALWRGNPVVAATGVLYAALFLLPLHRSFDALMIVRLGGLIGGTGLTMFGGGVDDPFAISAGASWLSLS